MVSESGYSEKSYKIVDKLHVVGNNLSNNKSIENRKIIKKFSNGHRFKKSVKDLPK